MFISLLLTSKQYFQDTSTVYMEEARLETVELCHPEKRNRSGKVFGGHIMRKAIELAWTSAYVFSKQVRNQPFEKG